MATTLFPPEVPLSSFQYQIFGKLPCHFQDNIWLLQKRVIPLSKESVEGLLFILRSHVSSEMIIYEAMNKLLRLYFSEGDKNVGRNHQNSNNS